ncbi:M20/M25/M40 family metallo-hydrolase [Lacticaseibacillus chiayiensis]|uniref:M20/M25/M40 family metallo-hydrolase n=1 Tax=Lacticaseibacillus chiayiensis TaxID=2100821 RepID=UPI003C7449D5
MMPAITKPVKVLRDLIACNSVSANDEGQQAARQKIVKILEDDIGAKVTLLQTSGKPIIFATVPGERQDALLFYGHYDVMNPGDLTKWHSDPFKLEKRDGRFYGRGAGDNKGQLVAMLTGISQFLATKPKLPYTIQFLIEGEEEQGSVNLPIAVREQKDKLLRHVKKVFVTDGSMNANGAHVLRLGNRGLFGLRLTAKTATHANHSGNAGNVIANPVNLLHEVLEKLYDFTNHRVLIPGFYDGIEPPTAQEMAWIDALPFDAVKVADVFGSQLTTTNKQSYYKKLMFEPTFNINGMAAGNTGKDVKTIIPSSAFVSIDMRLVGGQNIETIKAGAEKLLAPYLTAGTLNYAVTGAIPPTVVHPSERDLFAFKAASDEAHMPLLIEPRMPGTDPNYVWTDILGVPVFTVPLANFDQNNHAPNENITEDTFTSSIRFMEKLIMAYEKRGS